MNLSKVRDPRFRRRWEHSGALGTIDGPVPSYRQIMDELSNQNHQHMVMTSRISYAIEWLPTEVFTMETMSKEEAQRQTTYWQIGLLHRVRNSESVHHLFPTGMLHEIEQLLEEVEMEGFRTADDSLSRCHPELQLSEVWLCNADDDDEGWDNIGFQYMRLGNTAYDRWHNPVEGLIPVFVKKDEYVARGSPGAMAR